MIEFEAHKTTYAYAFLVHIQAVALKDENVLDSPLRAIDVLETTQNITAIEKELRSLKLLSALAQSQRILAAVSANPAITYRRLGTQAEELRLRMHDDLKLHLYLFVPSTDAELYSSPRLFGDKVAENFPSADFDITEAGKCLAVGRDTACVFHLMRAMEVALRALTNSLSSPYGANWNKTLNDFDKTLGAIRDTLNLNGAQKPVGWEENEQFYSEASALLRNVKNAWRNNVMHLEQKYTSDEARQIFHTTKSAMHFLATKLKETVPNA